MSSMIGYQLHDDSASDAEAIARNASQQLDELLQEALACANKTTRLRKELSEVQGQVQRVERENEALKRMLAEMRELCQTLTMRLKDFDETCVELETAKIRRLQAEHVAHEKAAAEQRALQRIKALEGSVSTLQAQKDQMARLNEQLMRQKASMEERLRDTKVSSFAHGPQQQDIVFYKNKCIELQQENALLRQAAKTARQPVGQVERHSNVKLSSSSAASQSRKQKRM